MKKYTKVIAAVLAILISAGATGLYANDHKASAEATARTSVSQTADTSDVKRTPAEGGAFKEETVYVLYNNNSDVKDYGDNRLLETDKSTTGGTLSVEFNHDSVDIYTMLLGHSIVDGTIKHNANDVAPYVGTGALGKEGNKWVGKFYKKVQFAEPSDENSTKEENTTFNHITLEGDIFIPEDGEWKLQKRFDSLAEAKAWLEAQGCEVVYRLAEPEIIQVEPAAVSTRKGLNRFSCETGSIRFEYTADTKLYIDGAVQALREILENA